MAFEDLLAACRNNHLRNLRCEKALQTPDPLDLGELRRDTLFQFGVPVSKLRRLPPHLVV